MSGGMAMQIRDGARQQGVRISNIVMSVPHSGTRSLVDGGINGQDVGLEKWWHFYVHEHRLDERVHQGHRLHLHIPIREPLDVASTWYRMGKKLDGLLQCYESMFRVLERDDLEVTLYRTRDLPLHVGKNSAPTSPRRANPVLFRDTIRRQVLQPNTAFFEQHA